MKDSISKYIKRAVPAVVIVFSLVAISFFFIRYVPLSNRFRLRYRVAWESADSYVIQQMGVCRARGDTIGKCLTKLSEILLDQFSMKEILTYFRNNEANMDVFSFCHETTHFLGQELYKRVGDKKIAFNQCFEVCGAGCYHGVLEGYIKAKRLSVGTHDEILAQELNKFCGTPADHDRPLLYNECVHGIGHGTMFLTNRDLQRSLRICDALATPALCYKGVFMENSFWVGGLDAAGNYQKPRSFKPEDPLNPCNIVDEKYQWECYGEKAADFGSQTDWNFQKMLSLCKLIPDAYRDQCYLHIGAQFGLQSQNLDEVVSSCEVSPDVRRKNLCIDAAVTTIGDRYPENTDKLIDFCSRAKIETKAVCYEQMFGYMDNWGLGREKAQKVCDRISFTERAYTSWCRI